MSIEQRPNLPREMAQVVQLFCHEWPSESWCDLHVAVALSGGGDSMALLRLVLMVKAEAGGEGSVHALHVNHRLRGAESEADAQWCREQCDALGARLIVLPCNTAERAAQEGDGLEAAARSHRYELLTRAAEQVGARYLAMAHTRDDQAETVLFRLLRGSGLRGLSGIPKRRQLTSAVTLIRPLLACSREMLEKYLADLGQSSRSDSSNTDLLFTRNRIRHELLPKLRSDYNSNLDSSLLQLAAQAEEAEQLIEGQARQLLEQASVRLELGGLEPESPSRLSLSFSSSSEKVPALVCAAIRLAWREAKLPEQDMSYKWWRQLATLVEEGNSLQILNLPGEVRASVEQGKLLLEWHDPHR